MRYYLDTEFIEKPGSIQLISLGIVSEDGLGMYCESSEFNVDDADDWVRTNVIDRLFDPPASRDSLATIRDRVLSFVGSDKKPEFWGYYADYDWVVFCWLFGRMIDLPKHFPMYCRDTKQLLDAAGNPSIPFKAASEHNALSDAFFTRELHRWIDGGCQPLSLPPPRCVWRAKKEAAHDAQ